MITAHAELSCALAYFRLTDGKIDMDECGLAADLAAQVYAETIKLFKRSGGKLCNRRIGTHPTSRISAPIDLHYAKWRRCNHEAWITIKRSFKL